jgi:predicted HTH domain antitoxin
MKSLVLDLPESVELDEKEVKTLLAAKLFEKGTLSLGQAAELAGYTKRTFMELLANYNVSVFNIDEAELENDILNAKNYHI